MHVAGVDVLSELTASVHRESLMAYSTSVNGLRLPACSRRVVLNGKATASAGTNRSIASFMWLAGLARSSRSLCDSFKF